MQQGFADLQTLKKNTAVPLIIAAALSASVMAPLVCELVLGQLENAPMRPGDWPWALWPAVLGAVVAALVMRAGLRSRFERFGVFGHALVGGLVFPGLLLAPAGLQALATMSSLENFGLLLLAPFIITLFGAAVSLPAGAVFGVVFSLGAVRARREFDAPSHESPTRAWSYAAVLLLAASVVAVLLAATLEGSYCQAVFFVVCPLLGIEPPPGTDIAWTRFLVLPAPLLVAAAASTLIFAFQSRAARARADAIVRDMHPLWAIDDVPAEPDARALPLRESDRDAPDRRLVRLRKGAGAYRDTGEAVAYVAARSR